MICEGLLRFALRADRQVGVGGLVTDGDPPLATYCPDGVALDISLSQPDLACVVQLLWGLGRTSCRGQIGVISSQQLHQPTPRHK